MFGPSSTREYSESLIGSCPVDYYDLCRFGGPMTSQLVHVPFEISLGKMNVLVSIAAASTISIPLLRCRTSVWCATSSNLIASYAVSVRQYRHHSLAYFSAWITPNHLATCLASRHDPSAYGTYTLWNTQFHELYSPFKAHTIAMPNGGRNC